MFRPMYARPRGFGWSGKITRTLALLALLMIGGPMVVPMIHNVALHVLPLVVIALALSFVRFGAR